MTIKTLMRGAKQFLTKNGPEISIGLGVVGLVTTTVLAVKATPRALTLIEQEKCRINNALFAEATEEHVPKRVEKLKPMDAVKVTWKCYAPAAILGTVSVACIVGASSVNARRNAALATAYKLSESALKEYQSKVVETVGEKKEQAIRDAVAKDIVQKEPVQNKEVILTGKGETLCYDVVSGRYFKSDIDKLKKSENNLNRRMRDEMYISLNDFYYEIGLDCVKMGDDLGWNIDEGYIDLRFSSQLATDGTPCLVIDYSYGPKYDFRTLM